jgi:hypothetical protein
LEFVGVVILYFLGAFFVAGFFFVVASSRRDERLTRTWSAYAARRRYHVSQGMAPERPVRIAGSREALDFFLEVDARNGVVTRLVARASWSAVGRVVAAQGRGRRRETTGKMPTGDVHFDHLFDVRGSDARAVERVLRPAVRMALMRFPMRMVGGGLRLAVEDDEVVVEWAGGETDPVELDAAHAILGEVCRDV